MTEIQLKLLNMLSFFHNFCVNENLRYYVIDGTALGAMRHGGFIPWDDDIDVGMPREDYERFKKLVANLSLKDYTFEFYGNSKEFTYTFGKMYDKNTTLIENKRYPVKRGIYLDIFPMDGAGNTYSDCLEHFKKLKRKRDVILTRTCGLRKGRNPIKNFSVLLMRCIPEFILNTSKLVQRFESQCMSRCWDESTYVASFSEIWNFREIVKKEWLGTPTERNFQGIKVMCPEFPEQYLAALYGDWETPPPTEKQKSHHDYIYINLNKSYLIK